jgi:glutamine synthetase
VPWLPGTALVLGDLLDHHTDPVPHSPRAILKKQVARARAMGFEPMMATELEFYLFENSYEALRDSNCRDLRTGRGYNEDYHIFQTTKEEDVMRAVRNGLYGAGIPVENSKGEADAGQEEINYRYSDALDTADNHVDHQARIKEIAWSKGKSVTFMAKYDHRKAGSSSHVHQSLWTKDGKPAFCRPGRRARHVGADEALHGRATGPCPRDDRVPGALCQQLQALYRRHVRPDQSGVECRQPHRRLPGLRRCTPRRSGWNAAFPART